jgi:lysophospholipase L1-like esterase
MSKVPLLYFPLFAPPQKDGTDPSAYYSALGSTADVVSRPDCGLEISFTNPQAAYPPDQIATPTSLAALFAPTRGFLTFYPGAAALPTPDLQPLTPPPGSQPSDLGTLVLRIWAADHRRLGSTVPPGTLRPTHVVMGGVLGSKVETALAPVVAALGEKVLRKSWQDAGGTGTIAKPALEAAYLQRVMSNSAEIFVSAGAPIGAATTIFDTATASTLGWLLLRTFGQNSQNVAIDTEAMDFLDDIFAATGSGAPGSIYDHHPLVLATSAEQTVHFQCQMSVWDNALNPTRNYMPFENGQVTLLRNGQLEGSAITTDSAGNVNFTTNLSPRDNIAFEYSTINRSVGMRVFTTNIRTISRRLGSMLGAGAVVTTAFRAKYDVFTEYFAFWQTLRQNEAVEKYGPDRGNSQTGIRSYKNQEGWLFSVLEESERKYRIGPAPSSHFNVLYEGDSWLFYPRSKDIYQWLHDYIPRRLQDQFVYSAFPLQHFGDRTDQMFAASAPVVVGPPDTSGGRQWTFTQEYLQEYPIDLIVLSAGGNDIAEPGISVNDKDYFLNIFNGDCFDAPGMGLPQAKKDVAKNLMHRSFSILLRNHPWNVAATPGHLPQKTIAQMISHLNGPFMALGNLYGGIGATRKKMADEILSFPDRLDFPYSISTPEEVFLDTVFDSTKLAERLDTIRDNIEILVQEAATYGIPIVAHSCCYPFYNEEPTRWADWIYATGPWFANRFLEANIINLRVKLICMKGLVDSYENHVLKRLHDSYQNTFHYADIRSSAMDAGLWNDEMHLKNKGYEQVSKVILDKIISVSPGRFKS